MTPRILEAKLIDGKPAHRLEGALLGIWVIANTPIDAILRRVAAQLGNTIGEIRDAAGIPGASASRCRKGQMPIVDGWLLRLSDYSGIPVSELRQVACIEPSTRPHPNARGAA